MTSDVLTTADIDIAADLSGVQESKLVSQFFGTPWSVYSEYAQTFVETLKYMDLGDHIRSQLAGDDAAGRASVQILDGVAVMDVRGLLTKYGSSLAMFPGYVSFRRAVRAAANDSRVESMLLLIDSPGGAAMGLDDAAQAVADFAAVKPVTAFIEDLGASAGYYLASQATRVVANSRAVIGAIGTVAIVEDTSAQAEMLGIKVHVLSTGKHKGDFVPGTQVTDEQLTERQRMIDGFGDAFVEAVARGRGMSVEQVRELADGRVHMAAEAVDLGLIDAVETQDQAIDALRGLSDEDTEGDAMNTRKESAMTDANTPEPEAAETNPTPQAATPAPEPPAPVAATHAEIRSALPKSTADFRERCVDQGLTLTECQSRYIDELEASSDEGPEPVGTGVSATSGASSASQEWHNQIEAEAQRNGGDRAKAAITVNRKNPDLREQVLQEANAA